MSCEPSAHSQGGVSMCETSCTVGKLDELACIAFGPVQHASNLRFAQFVQT